MDYSIIKELFKLDDIIIDNIINDKKQIQIHLKLEQKEHICPKCRNKVNRVHDYYKQKIRDLDILGNETYIILKKRRYRCKCGKVFQEENNFLNKRQRITKRLFAKILKMLNTTHSFTSIGRELGLSTNTIIRAFDRLNYPKANLENTEVFSIDEFKGNTGGQKYNCIIADPKTKQVLDILPNRKFADLVEYTRNQKRENIKYFISDMWRPYRDLAKTFFKEATFIVDKYHWTRQCIWAFENVRKEEQKKFYKEYRKYFKKSKTLLKKRFNFLTEEEKIEVNYMLYKSDNIRIAHQLKEDFLNLLDLKNRKNAKKLLTNWIIDAQESNIKAFEKCANSMVNWSNGILNSFEIPYTNGFIEGCNNKIKVLKRNAYGYRNFKRFRNRILHIFQHKKETLENKYTYY